LRPLACPRFHVERRARQKTGDGAFHVKHAIEARDFFCPASVEVPRGTSGGQVRGISCRVFHVEHECRPSARRATSNDRCLKFSRIYGNSDSVTSRPHRASHVKRRWTGGKLSHRVPRGTQMSPAAKSAGSIGCCLKFSRDPKGRPLDRLAAYRAFHVELPVPEPSRGLRLSYASFV
jgi:hypothetical protein